MTTIPLVSVIIPTYNCGKYIADAIESVLSQRYEKLEIIVVDDGSTDGTGAALAPYSERIIYVHQRNQGVVAARNAGIQQSRGELIAFLDADDVWYQGKLALQVEALQRYPGSGLSFTDCCYFDEVGPVYTSFFGPIVRTWIDKHTYQDSSDVIHGWMVEELLQSNCMHTSSVIVRRGVLGEVGYFDEAFEICQDYDLWLRVAHNYPVVCVKRMLCGWRYRPEGLSGPQEMREVRWNREWIEILEKHIRKNMIPNELHGLAKTVLSQRYWRLGWLNFSRNHLREARALFLRGIHLRPFQKRHWIYLGASLLPVSIIKGLRRIKRGLS